MREFNWPVRVYYEDTDAVGVVYYTNYLKFMERARTEWLRSLGFEQDTLSKDFSILFAVKKVTIEYIKPAWFNELLNVKSWITGLRKTHLVFDQTIFNAASETLSKAEVKIACLDSLKLKPVQIPEHIIAELDHDH